MGFDTDFFIDQPVDDNYICQICSDVQAKPKTVCDNGHTFCGGCIETYKNLGTAIRRNKNCPSCRVVMSGKEVPNLPLQSIIMGLQVRCSRSESGCPWTGSLDNYNNCHNKNGCEYKLVTCEKCEELVSEIKMADHLKLECPERVTLCPYCLDDVIAKDCVSHVTDHCPDRPAVCYLCYGTFTAETLNDHKENQCPERLVHCGLCHKFLTVRALSDHETNECPERTVKCSGCDKDIKVKVLGKHKVEECRGRLVACSHCHMYVPSKDLGTIIAPQGAVKGPPICTGHMFVCPKVRVPCEFACHGCKERIPRQDVEIHGKDFVGIHSKLLSEAMKKMQDDVMWETVTLDWEFSSRNYHQLDSELKTKLVTVGAFEVGVGLTVMEDDEESIQVKLRTWQRGFSTQFDSIRITMEIKENDTAAHQTYEWNQPGTFTPNSRVNNKGKSCQFVMVPLAAGADDQKTPQITLGMLGDLTGERDCNFSFSFRLRKPSALTVSV